MTCAFESQLSPDGAPPAHPISLAEYLATDYHPDCDYIDGRATSRNVGLYPHASAMTVLAGSLYDLTRGTDLLTLMSVRMRVNANTVLVPDVSVIRKTSPREDIIATPPLLVVEILSPEDAISHLQWRVNTYSAMGVEHIWVIDAWKRYVWYASIRGFQQPADGALRIAGTPIQVILAELFAELDEN